MADLLRIVCGVCGLVRKIPPHKIMDDPKCCRQHMLIAGAAKTDIRTGKVVDPVDNVRPVREFPMGMTGKDLRKWRERRGFTQQHVARLLGLDSRQTILNYEAMDEIPRKIELLVVALDHLAEHGAAA